MKLNLGCGNTIKKGWTNLDIVAREGVDVIHDVNELPLPFISESFEYILCRDILEHINYLPLMSELHRILIEGGILRIRVPHFTSRSNYADPTHINMFSSESFRYFIESGHFAYERGIKFFSKVFVRLEIEKSKKVGLRQFYNLLGSHINKSRDKQKAYERTALRVFPTESIHVILIK